MKNEEAKTQKQIIKRILAEQLGIDVSDIENDDSLTHELHMDSADITDFFKSLQSQNIDTAKLDITLVDTLEDLFEALGLGE
jgi:acyl carrier protein